MANAQQFSPSTLPSIIDVLLLKKRDDQLVIEQKKELKMAIRPHLGAVFGVILLTGCGAVESRLNGTTPSARGLSASLESIDVAALRKKQDIFITNLEALADLTPPLNTSGWQNLTKAGFYVIGEQCDLYMDALFRYDRDQKALRAGLTATGATAATIMGLTATPAAPIAATAAVFGLASSYFDADISTVLYTLGPAAVRGLVQKSMAAYADNTTKNIDNIQARADAFLAMQGYLRLCTPIAIESEVEQASSSSNFQPDPKTDKNPQTNLQQYSTLPAENTDDSTDLKLPAVQRIIAWLKTNPGNPAQLQAWINAESFDVSLQGQPWAVLIGPVGPGHEFSEAELQTARSRAIGDLSIP